jgi:hypothetical protein
MHFNPVILSELRGTMTLSLRRGMETKEESKDPRAVSHAMPPQGVLSKMFLVELPKAAWLQNSFSGSFDFAPISHYSSKFQRRFAQDDRTKQRVNYRDSSPFKFIVSVTGPASPIFSATDFACVNSSR